MIIIFALTDTFDGYFARKYKPNGQLINTIYYPSEDKQIIFNKDGSKYTIKKGN